jgi:hypothetical protein
MFRKAVVVTIVNSATLFAQCVRQELDRAGTDAETRQQLSVLFDNALVRYAGLKPDSVTQQAVAELRPKLRKMWGA